MSQILESKQMALERRKTLDFLGELSRSAGEARSFYIPYRSPLPDLSRLPGMNNSRLLADITDIIKRSPTSAVLFWGTARKCLVVPPFPLITDYQADGYDASLLCSLLEKDRSVALVLVRLGSYAVGLARGERLETSKVGTGLVHGRHRQGGSSAHRFERHRDKQIETFLTRVCQHVQEQLSPFARSTDYIVYGGAWTTILLIKKACPFLSQFDNRSLPPLLTIPEPRQPVLESAVRRVWSSTIIEWTGKP